MASYPTPVTSSSPPLTKTFRTVISFRVSVPVLSEQMTVVQPRVSTAGRRRMMARRFAARCTPIASAPVTTAARASGTAAIARLTPQMSISSTGLPRKMPSATTAAETPRQAMPSRFPM